MFKKLAGGLFEKPRGVGKAGQQVYGGEWLPVYGAAADSEQARVEAGPVLVLAQVEVKLQCELRSPLAVAARFLEEYEFGECDRHGG